MEYQHKYQHQHFYIGKESISEFKDLIKQFTTNTIKLQEDYYEDLPYHDSESNEDFKDTSLMKNNIWLKKVTCLESKNSNWSVKILKSSKNSTKLYEYIDPDYDNIKLWVNNTYNFNMSEFQSLKHIGSLNVNRTSCKLPSGLVFNTDDVNDNKEFKYYIITCISDKDIIHQLKYYMKDVKIYRARSKIVKYIDEVNPILYGELLDDEILEDCDNFFDDYESDLLHDSLLREYEESMKIFDVGNLC